MKQFVPLPLLSAPFTRVPTAFTGSPLREAGQQVLNRFGKRVHIHVSGRNHLDAICYQKRDDVGRSGHWAASGAFDSAGL